MFRPQRLCETADVVVFEVADEMQASAAGSGPASWLISYLRRVDVLDGLRECAGCRFVHIACYVPHSGRTFGLFLAELWS